VHVLRRRREGGAQWKRSDSRRVVLAIEIELSCVRAKSYENSLPNLPSSIFLPPQGTPRRTALPGR
jgi:hypothetical protein